jgi:hypothetical protein
MQSITSDFNAFYFIDRDIIASPVLKLDGLRRFLGRNLLGIFKRSATLDVGGDTVARNVWQQVE